jgi:aspartate/methionine/tyrosine aminotransferase
MIFSDAVRGTPECAAGRYFGCAPKDAINLSIGEPLFPPPESVVSAYAEAGGSGAHRYAPIQGYADLREALAEKLKTENGIQASPEEIIITNGATEAIGLSIMSLVGRGDEVVVFEPNYPIVSPMVIYCGGRPVTIPLKEKDGFQIDTETLKEKVSGRTKLVVINSPHNPTGTVLKKETMRALSEICNAPIISDEVYEKFVFEGEHHSLSSVSENPGRVITVNSFSKSYCMCGYRVGYLHGPRELISQMTKLKLYLSNCCPAPSQRAALAALHEKGFPDSIRNEVGKSREALVIGLKRLGISFTEPVGAFYAFPDVSRFGGGDEFYRMLLKAGVIAMPGCIFGKSHSGHIRFSFACRSEDVKECFRRIGDWRK